MKRLLRTGAPWGIVALGALACVAVLLTVVDRESQSTPRGFATIRAEKDACSVDHRQSRDVLACARVRPNVYSIQFSRRIGGRPVSATRATCCPGPIGASVESDTTVLVTLPRQRDYPVVLTVVVS